MDVHKRKIVKSKSSNSALVKKVEQRNSKSKSSAQIEHFAKTVKKRGVYVENRPVMSLSAQGQNIPEKKSAPPRAGRKQFLNSVLTILSKSSTGTQYPSKDDPKPKYKKKRSENKPTSANKEFTEMRNESDTIKINCEPEKKKKFRSRVLNRDRDYADKFEIIQRKKEIRFSPLESSSKEDIKWSDFPKLGKKNDEERSIVSDLVKQISEGQKIKPKLEKDPSTLVTESHKNDKNMYNFFVDFLETTFTLYDVKDTKDKVVRSVSSSKVAFEIDEQVAQKLKVTKPPMFDDVTQKPSRQHHNVNAKIDQFNDEWNKDKRDYLTDETAYRTSSPYHRSNSPVAKKKLKSASFFHSKNRQPKPPKILSSSTQNVKQIPSKKKRPKKQDLLNILRAEIAKDPSVYEEPQSIYDALKILARNKRKCQKNLRFANGKKNTSDVRDDDCMKKRRVMRPSASFRYNKKISQNTHEGQNVLRNKMPEIYEARKGPKSKMPEIYEARRGPKSKVPETNDTRKVPKRKVPERYAFWKVPKITVPETHENETSAHSIEVYGFDYTVPTKSRSRRKREVSLPYHSSSSEYDDCDF